MDLFFALLHLLLTGYSLYLVGEYGKAERYLVAIVPFLCYALNLTLFLVHLSRALT